MPVELSSAGLEPQPQPRLADGLFFAVFPDSHTAARIAQLAQRLRSEHALKGQPLETQRFHVTLHYLGNYAGLPQDIVAKASAAAQTVAIPQFDVAFDRVASFSRKRRDSPFVLLGEEGVAALTAFQQTLGVALEHAGFEGIIKSHYTPHVTLLYGDHAVASQVVETLRWSVREFVLVHSLLGQTQYLQLARWQLRS
ncbi:RNA 2',3'-cyclic phosphodiesterase [Burkholderia sp. L27(2015)]|uniref:RNA 2',3'-cyclic phosphodiesterase n=1 Tax=Burkholderia sp. L27(2015) TaxID=1641858 RepID=UPI00131D4621|nr:RNA 2',3'-cyclic phosphodiesterase [Burkholderia sp. L27(2015)]